MATTKEVINELNNLMGSQVYYWGSYHSMQTEVGKYQVDIRPILEALEEYELDEELTKVDESEVTWNTSRFDIVLDRLLENGMIESDDYVNAGNSYNWNSPVSNEYDWREYKATDGSRIYAMQIHRGYGDVRCNYTDFIWYKSDDYSFWSTIAENGIKSNYVDLQGKLYWCDVDVNYDGIHVSTEDGDNFYVYDYISNDKEMLEAIKEEIGFKTWLEICHELINAKKGA